jgi:hypothetical protein
MLTKTDKLAVKAYIHEHVLTPEVSRLARLARIDLNFGPIGDTADDGKPYPGYVSALATISDAMGATRELWYASTTGEITPNEPMFDPDDNYEDWAHLDRRTILSCAFGELGGEL